MCRDIVSNDMFLDSLTFSGAPGMLGISYVFLVLLDLHVLVLPLVMLLDHGLLVMASF